MKKHSFTVALAASALAITWAGTSLADDDTTTTTTEPPASSTTVVTPSAQPVQPAPSQSVTVQAPPGTGTTTTTAAPYAPLPEGQEMYAERSTEHRPNRTLLSTGVGMFVISYGASVVAGAVSDRDEDQNLFIPVVGPWIDLNDRGSCTGCSNEGLNKAMLITSGIVQGAGVLLGLGSLVIPETTTTTERRSTAEAKPEVHVLPVSFGAGAGVGAVGRF
jgi:hypothetical protein